MTKLLHTNTDPENVYNECITRSSNVVERQYGILKGPSLQLKMGLSTRTIMTVFVLRNKGRGNSRVRYGNK